MSRTPLARPGSSRTSPRTNSVRPPMRSRPHVPALRRARARATAPGDSNAGGSVTSSRRRFANSYLTTSGCGTASAGRRLTAERAPGRPHRPQAIRMDAYPFATIELIPDAYGGSLVPMLEQYVAAQGGMSQDEATAWADEQRKLGERGEFFFTVTQFCLTASR